jgi:hypothetical protein
MGSTVPNGKIIRECFLLKGVEESGYGLSHNIIPLSADQSGLAV